MVVFAGEEGKGYCCCCTGLATCKSVHAAKLRTQWIVGTHGEGMMMRRRRTELKG